MPREEQDKENSKIMQDLVDYQWTQSNMEKKVEEMVLSGLLYGTGILKIGWDQKTENPLISNVDILSLYVDPDAVSPESVKWVILRMMRTKEYIKSKYNYDVTDVGTDQEKTLDNRFTAQDVEPPQNRAKDDGLVEVLEYWTPSTMCVVINRKEIVKEQENTLGKIPFVFFRDYIVPNEFYAIGEVEHIHMLQTEANSLRNQIMDNNNLLINQMWKVKKSSGINPRNLVSKPGMTIGVTDMGDIEPIVNPGLPNWAFNLQEVIKGDIQQTTGVTDYQVGPGQNTSLNETATGIGLIQEAGNQRFKSKIRHLEESIRDLGEFFVQLNQALITQPKVIRITGSEGVEWKQITDMTDLKGNFDIDVQAGSTKSIDPQVEIQKLNALVQFASLPQFAPYVKWRELLAHGVDTFDVVDKDVVLKTEEEMQMEQMQQMGQQGGTESLDQLAQLPPDQQQAVLSTLDPQEAQLVQQEMNG